eukprot:PhM_4_TR4801/c0_g1_i1/m.26294
MSEIKDIFSALDTKKKKNPTTPSSTTATATAKQTRNADTDATNPAKRLKKDDSNTKKGNASNASPDDGEKKKKKKAKGTGNVGKFVDRPKTLAVQDNEFFDLRGEATSNATRKIVDGGYALYTEEELLASIPKSKRKMAGKTALCPFDCDCCF